MTTIPTDTPHPDRRVPRVGLLLLAGALTAVALTGTACTSGSQNASSNSTTESASSQTTAPSETTQPSTTPSEAAPAAGELKITDKVVGKGATAKAGDTVTVDYTGWLMDGTKFDSSIDRKQPFTFPLGGGQVIPGWDKGVQGMKVGGTRILVIPPDLAYGDQGAGGVIPPGATLKFEVKLLKVESAK